MKTTIIVTSIVMILAGLGCASLSSLITPATIDQRAVEYVVESGYADPNEFAGYPNLDKAVRLTEAVNGSHQLKQLAYQQKIDVDKLTYAQISKIVAQNKEYAIEREELLFGQDGLLTLGLSMAGFGTLTGFIGLMRKRPQDVTPEEVEAVLADMSVDLTDKERQITELIRGIQSFLDLDSTDAKTNALLKNLLSAAQNKDTKVKVAEVKATL